MKRRSFLKALAGFAGGMEGLALMPQASAAEGAQKMMEGTLVIEACGKTFRAQLEDNATARALAKRLPMTIDFEDLYSRELCSFLKEALPAEEVKRRGYEVGEIIYWPPQRCLVILYAQNSEHFGMQPVGRMSAADVAALPKSDFKATLRFEP